MKAAYSPRPSSAPSPDGDIAIGEGFRLTFSLIELLGGPPFRRRGLVRVPARDVAQLVRDGPLETRRAMARVQVDDYEDEGLRRLGGLALRHPKGEWTSNRGRSEALPERSFGHNGMLAAKATPATALFKSVASSRRASP